MANWLQQHPDVSRVLYPALPDDPGHELWKRDFEGACGLFGVLLNAHHDDSKLGKMLDGLELFAAGAAGVATESLILPAAPIRTATTWEAEGSLRDCISAWNTRTI